MDIIISNSSGIPIYEQIVEQIRSKILSGELEKDELLPSIRSLAKDLRCSVITTKNAYEELERLGFIHSVPSKGFYVSHINKEMLREEELNKMEQFLERGIEIAKKNQVSKKELKEIIDIIYEGSS